MTEFNELRVAATACVQMWLASPPDDALGRFSLSEMRSEILDIEDDTAAAKMLESLFTERLCVDPGVPGPYGSLGADLISLALDLVGWEVLARWIKFGDEYNPNPDKPEDEGDDEGDEEENDITLD